MLFYFKGEFKLSVYRNISDSEFITIRSWATIDEENKVKSYLSFGDDIEMLGRFIDKFGVPKNTTFTFVSNEEDENDNYQYIEIFTLQSECERWSDNIVNFFNYSDEDFIADPDFHFSVVPKEDPFSVPYPNQIVHYKEISPVGDWSKYSITKTQISQLLQSK